MRTGLYFGAGPAALPNQVVTQAAAEFVEYQNVGVGLGEMSHRSAQATEIVNAAKIQIRQTLDVPNTHEIFFCQAGGTGGFASCLYALAAYKFKTQGGNVKLSGDYIVSGSWSSKAHDEAKKLGFSSTVIGKPEKYTEIPVLGESTGDFLYYCDNETVHGVEFPGISTTPPLQKDLVVCDISSNMFSRPIDVSKYAILFGGAQKNLGIPGVTLYIARKDILDAQKNVDVDGMHAHGIPLAPSSLDLGLTAANNSCYNTVSIFAIEVIKLVTANTLAHGGIAHQSKESKEKADKLYKEIDARPDMFVATVKPQFRSRMNIVFNLKDKVSEERFLKLATERQISGVKGHRSVGGIRVSNYNAITPEAIETVAELMKSF